MHPTLAHIAGYIPHDTYHCAVRQPSTEGSSGCTARAESSASRIAFFAISGLSLEDFRVLCRWVRVGNGHEVEPVGSVLSCGGGKCGRRVSYLWSVGTRAWHCESCRP